MFNSKNEKLHLVKMENQQCDQVGFRVKNPQATTAFKILTILIHIDNVFKYTL